MDVKFSTDLQTALQVFGYEGKFAPPKSQDPFDKLLHEMYITGSAAMPIMKRRRDVALDMIQQDERVMRDVNRLVSDAIKHGLMQNGTLVATEHYHLLLKVAKPVEKVDVTLLKTELVKLGVDLATIAKAENAAQKTNAPAKTFNVVTTHGRS
jgi:hypothetical protein